MNKNLATSNNFGALSAKAFIESKIKTNTQFFFGSSLWSESQIQIIWFLLWHSCDRIVKRITHTCTHTHTHTHTIARRREEKEKKRYVRLCHFMHKCTIQSLSLFLSLPNQPKKQQQQQQTKKVEEGQPYPLFIKIDTRQMEGWWYFAISTTAPMTTNIKVTCTPH